MHITRWRQVYVMQTLQVPRTRCDVQLKRRAQPVPCLCLHMETCLCYMELLVGARLLPRRRATRPT